MDKRKNIIFIVNPCSGTSGKQKILALIEELLNRDLFEWEVRYTEHAGHASEIAKEASNRSVDIVCAIGGDGTVNETARAIVHTNTALAIIPAGSGNGLARHLHIPMDPRGAIQVITECNIHPMD